MIRTILIVFVTFMALAFGIMWILSGGFARTANQTTDLTGFFGFGFGKKTDDTSTFKLPWQPSALTGPNLEKQVREWNESRPAEEQIADIQEEVGIVEFEINALENPTERPNAIPMY